MPNRVLLALACLFFGAVEAFVVSQPSKFAVRTDTVSTVSSPTAAVSRPDSPVTAADDMDAASHSKPVRMVVVKDPTITTTAADGAAPLLPPPPSQPRETATDKKKALGPDEFLLALLHVANNKCVYPAASLTQ